MRRIAARPIAVAMAMAMLAGCQSGQDPTIEPQAATTTTESAVATSAPVATTAFEGGTTEVSTPPTPPPDPALLDQVTVGSHEGFERVVFRFTNKVPGYRVAPTKPPILEDASGRQIAVKGEAFVQVSMSLASGFDQSAPEGRQVYTGPNRVTGATSLITEVVKTGDFEAVLSWVIGLESAQPFRITTISSPPRLVVDIKSP